MSTFIEEAILLAVLNADQEGAEARLRTMNRVELKAFKSAITALGILIDAEDERQYLAVTPNLTLDQRMSRLFDR